MNGNDSTAPEWSRMNQTLQFRIATANDVQLLAQLNASLIQDEGHRNPMSLPELAERMQRWIEQEYRAVLFERNGTTVAYALFCIGDQFGERFIFLRQFFVHHAFRRQGIGREAFHLLSTEVLPSGMRVILDVLFDNAAGRAFWHAMGFKEQSLTLEHVAIGQRVTPSCSLSNPTLL